MSQPAKATFSLLAGLRRSRIDPAGQPAIPFIYAAIILLMGGTLLVDLYTLLGIGVWAIYFLPIILSFWLGRPIAPLIIALLATALMTIDFLISPSKEALWWVAFSRSCGFIAIWAVAIDRHFSIKDWLAIQQHEWLQSGQVGLSKAIGGEQRLEQLGESTLRFLAEYLGAHVGAFFAKEGDIYRRIATFATYSNPAADGVPEEFGLGDGLLGQAAKDGRLFLVQEVPDGYLNVKSALGQGKPRHLLIAPIATDKTVNGVIELGFIHPLNTSTTELLEKVTESISVAIKSAHYRIHLQNLLKEKQQQTSELQARDEELRVLNEELEEQNRMLKESQTRLEQQQAELEQQQAELEQTNTQLEEQTERLEAQREDLVKAKAAVQAQARELEQASRYKSEFLANMSHELRTPLNSSLILAKLLADNPQGNLSDEQVRYAQTILSAGNDLLALINDILDLAKVEAGRIEVRPEPTSLAELMDNLRRIFEPIAGHKGITFSTLISSECRESIYIDRQRLEQVLKNLLSNAMKFTDKGEVTLSVSGVPNGRISFAIIDTGSGIPEDQQQVVFEAFRQAESTADRKYGGTGLGLSIARELTQLLGGDIHLMSEPGRGSTFTVTVPESYDPGLVQRCTPVEEVSNPQPLIEPASPADTTSLFQQRQPAAPPAPTHPHEDDRERLTADSRTLLVVEDDESFARLLYDLAHELDFQCLIATTAEEARVMAMQYLPSAVVLDIGLPDRSGLSVLDQLKQDARTRHIPIHVVSASDYAHTALSLGAAGYMLKPVKREELVQALKHIEARLTQRMRQVLIVEDNPIQLDSLRELLGSHVVETTGARSAAECLERLKEETFDCMVLDLSLPDASGFSLLETLSCEDAYSFPPVIVYTGRDLSAGEEQRLRRYSQSIIIKGAKSPERLLDEVTLFLHQVVAELPPEQQRMLDRARNRDAVLEDRRILIVEDDVRNVFALTSILEPRGAIVQIARNGREALEILEKSLGDSRQPIDLVLMDVMMPEMDGLTATREIRKHPEWKNLPIIMLTAKAMKNDQEDCFTAGANDYMAKPLDVEKLLSLVRVWMPR
ncbi:response regulator [Nitrosococcus wardiae]|uniref:histidine kinase n=1 Tax=Nitrosococcus wardiae TaxID=1814290 RepID=A0A4V1AVU0_9GAMM|nr:response regulator [Nitrosococcus wardiae]QBQ54305.1 response regulator [Nitrosococcus wardiae]